MDFVSKQVPLSEFKQEFDNYWPKFIAHHNDAKWLDNNDFLALKRKLPRGRVAFVIDFAENYSHKPRFEHKSKYFSQVQTTILPVVCMIRVDDLKNMSEAEREELLHMLDEMGLPHVISENHFIISSDMEHDNAFVQKALDDFILPYLKENVTDVYVRSDG